MQQITAQNFQNFAQNSVGPSLRLCWFYIAVGQMLAFIQYYIELELGFMLALHSGP